MQAFNAWRWRRLLVESRLALRLFRDPRVPAAYKVVPFFALLYLLAPIDLMPDFIPIGGQLDDIAVALAALKVFVTLARDDHRPDSGADVAPSDVVSATYRVRED